MSEMSLAILNHEIHADSVFDLVLNGLTSNHSRRAYRRAIAHFLTWHSEHHRPRLNKACVQSYLAFLHDEGLSAANINQRLSALRKLAVEAADNNYLDPHLAAGIQAIRGVRQKGRRSGNWLVREQAQALRDAPEINRLKGLRDRALLAVLLGCGLRRSEAAELRFSHLQQREGRWAIVDLVGKGNRLRTVPMPAWTKSAVDEWTQAAGLDRDGSVFRPLNKSGKVSHQQMTAQAIHNVVKAYAEQLGLEGLAPHDLRRTFAKLAHKGGAALEQIQLSLGHSSIKTTEAYVGVEQDFIDAPCDRLGLR